MVFQLVIIKFSYNSSPDANGDGIKFNAYVSPVCLPRSDVMYYQRGRNVTITGWGKVFFFSNTLLKLE